MFGFLCPVACLLPGFFMNQELFSEWVMSENVMNYILFFSAQKKLPEWC